MQFFEKLDFLMNITNTSNSALGQKVRLDPSYISRLRKGKRNASKDEAVINNMADYFARHCVSDYQRKALSDTLNINMAVFDIFELSEYIAKWLINKKDDEIKAIGGFLDNLNKLDTNSKLPTKKTCPGIVKL